MAAGESLGRQPGKAGGWGLPLRPNSRAQSLEPQLVDPPDPRRAQRLLGATTSHPLLPIPQPPPFSWVHLSQLCLAYPEGTGLKSPIIQSPTAGLEALWLATVHAPKVTP